MTRILFVCLGNICRSPMAEFLMKQWVAEQDMAHLFAIDSAGTSGWHNGEDMHCGTAEILDGLNINTQGFVSSQVSVQDLERYDYIVAMDSSNVQALHSLFQQTSPRLFVITDLVPHLGYQGVPDPWYTKNFIETRDLLQQACKVLLEHIQSDS